MKRDDGWQDERLERAEHLLRRAAAESVAPEGIATRAIARRQAWECARRRRRRFVVGTAVATAGLATFLGLVQTAGRPPQHEPEEEFIRIAPTLLADSSGGQIAAAVESQRREAGTIDPRLARSVTVRVKATALSDLCADLREKTGIRLDAGPSVADEKVTLLCAERPLRDVLRSLSRPFGYTWVRSGKSPDYRYELLQDLRSQLLEEELRNRDRHAALLALETEIERYRPYLGLSADEALSRAKSASSEEKKLLEKLATLGWGPLQVYSRLTPRDLAAMRAGQTLTFSAEAKSGEEPLPADLARGVLESLRETRILIRDDGPNFVGTDVAGASPPASVSEARATVSLRINPSQLGQFTLEGGSGITLNPGHGAMVTSTDLATGVSPAIRNPNNGAINENLSRHPALAIRVTVEPEPDCIPTASGEPKKTTSAAVLEALHRASGLPIVADYYTRLYPVSAVSVRNLPLFDALNRLADTMRLRWDLDPSGPWLRFRSASYYDDRIKEVPNRLLSRWTASRRRHGALPLDDLVEIAQLSEIQLDSTATREGVKSCHGLVEWDLVQNGEARPHLRFLGRLTPDQRRAARSATGLSFGQMALAQQQQFIQLAMQSQVEPLPRLEDFAGSTLHVRYTRPGGFEWKAPDINARAARRPSDRATPRGPIELPPIEERTREAALLAARQIDSLVAPEEIVPTERAVTFLYTWGRAASGLIGYAVRITPNYTRRWDETTRPGDRTGSHQ